MLICPISLYKLSAAVGGGDVSGEEREMRLPSGVIPFQTQSDVGLNTQKVKKNSIACQSLKSTKPQFVIYLT